MRRQALKSQSLAEATVKICFNTTTNRALKYLIHRRYSVEAVYIFLALIVQLMACVAHTFAEDKVVGEIWTQSIREVHDEAWYLLRCAEARNAWAVLSFSVLSSKAIEDHRLQFPNSGEMICEYFARLDQPVTVIKGVLSNHPRNTFSDLDGTTAQVISQLRSRSYDPNSQYAVNFRDASIGQFIDFIRQYIGVPLVLEKSDATVVITVIATRRVTSAELVDLLDVMCRLCPCRLLPKQDGIIIVNVEEDKRWHKVVLSRKGTYGDGCTRARIKWKRTLGTGH